MSSDLQYTAEAQPNAPAGSTVIDYVDSADNNRRKAIHASGTVDILSETNRYNYLVSGGFDFIQRWPTALTTNTQTTQGTRYLMHDQWSLVSQTASCQVARIDTIAAPETGITARYYGELKQITGAGKVMYVNILEAKDTAPLRGKTVRFHIKYKTGVWGSGSALRMGVFQNNSSATADTVVSTTFVSAFGANSTDPTLGTNVAYISPLTTGLDGVTTNGAGGTTAGQIANPGASSAWTRASALFTIPTNCVNIMVAFWTDSQMSVNDIFYLTEAGLYLGQEINDWNPLSSSEEKLRVQRFYESSFPPDTAPVQNNGVNTGEMKWTAGIIGTGAEKSPAIQLAVPKRITITTGQTVIYNPAAANAQVRDETAGGDCSATAFVAGSERNFALTCTGNAGTIVGGLLGAHWSVDQAI